MISNNFAYVYADFRTWQLLDDRNKIVFPAGNVEKIDYLPIFVYDIVVEGIIRF
jgi:hypothetical protein